MIPHFGGTLANDISRQVAQWFGFPVTIGNGQKMSHLKAEEQGSDSRLRENDGVAARLLRPCYSRIFPRTQASIRSSAR